MEQTILALLYVALWEILLVVTGSCEKIPTNAEIG